MDSSEWRKNKDIKREQFMTEDEIKNVNRYIDDLNNGKGRMSDLYAEWENIENHYKNEPPEKTGRPNSKINILNANVEGQISQLIEQNIAVTTRGEGPSDEPFADWGRIGLDWTLRKNHIKRILSVHERRRLKFGVGILSVNWDPEAINKFGLVKIHPTPLNKLFVDGKIKDFLRFNESDYMCETINQSKQWFIDTYGEDKSEAIDFGQNEYFDNGVFQEEHTNDDEDSATLVLRWSRYKGKLRLEEFSACGVLLYDSHKKGKRTDNQKRAEVIRKPYYKYVDNKYPYFFTVLYPIEGQLHGFGDGKLLLPLQELINELYDKIRICARPDLILIDTNADVDVSDFDEDSLSPRYFDGTNINGQPVHSVKWGQINESWWRLLMQIHQEAQRVTRFSDLMIGQSKSADTATEAAIQQQQGSAATDHKKQMLQETLVEVCEYVLGLMMEFYTEGKAFRISEDKPEYKWIDFRKMANVPATKPATEAFKKQYLESNPGTTLPDWELITEGGTPQTKSVDLDIEISIGAGLPKNKAFLYQMVEKLSQMQAVNPKTGMPGPVVDLEELRKFIKDFLGIPLKDDQELMNIMQQPMPGQVPQPNQTMMNPNAPLTQNGNPQMSPIVTMRGGSNGFNS